MIVKEKQIDVMKTDANNQLRPSQIEMIEVKPKQPEVQSTVPKQDNIEVNNHTALQVELNEEWVSESGVKPQQNKIISENQKPKILINSASNEWTPKAAVKNEVVLPKQSSGQTEAANKPEAKSEVKSDNEAVEPSEKPKVIETHSTPLLLKGEKAEAADYGYSLDSKKVDETIGIIDIENICKCLAHAILKHIEFSKSEVLIDDLVWEDEDIPQFSYDFDYNLRIDLEELQRKKEMEEWEAQVRNIGMGLSSTK